MQGDPERPVLPPEALFLGTEQFYARANAYAQLAIRPEPTLASFERPGAGSALTT